MISTSNVSLRYGKRVLFEDVNVKFTPGNCYGLIGANGAGKSTFLKILSGELDPQTGSVVITPGERLAVLKQSHYEYDEYEVLETVIMGHKRLWEIRKEKDEIYMKPDFDEKDGIRASELEAEFADMNGWNAESEAGELLSGLGVSEEYHTRKLNEIPETMKVRSLLAQALFGNPDILLLDEPTNGLDAKSIIWLEHYLADFKNTVIVVSHDRHFLDAVCSHVADLDFGKIQLYAGNYSFWYESSQLALRQRSDQNKKTEEKRKELQDFIARFSANASKSKQATSRQKLLAKLTVDDIKPSSRRYPYINFKPEREAGNQILEVENLSKTGENGNVMFSKVSFMMEKGDKVAILGENDRVITAFFDSIMGEAQADSGTVRWGTTITPAYFQKDNAALFQTDLNLVDWLRQYSEEKDESFIRGFLGRMLFSGEESLKKSHVLSGGEKVRCYLSKLMLQAPNVLVMDEPTHHLDLESITALNNALRDFTGSVLFASHDMQFVDTVANRIIELTPNGIIDKRMSYDDYIFDEGVKAQRQKLMGALVK